MKTATGLTLVAIGAILAFAVHAHLHFLNLAIAGWVILLTGLVGLFVPRRGYGWLRGRVVVRHTQRKPVAGIAAPGMPPGTDGAEARSEGLQPPVSETIQEFFEE